MRALLLPALFLLACNGETLRRQAEQIHQQEVRIAELQKALEDQKAVAGGKSWALVKCQAQLEDHHQRRAENDARIEETVRRRMLDIERVLGEHVVDDQNAIIDLKHTLCSLRRFTERRFGRNREAARRALVSDFGITTGLAILTADCEVKQADRGQRQPG